VRIRNLTMQIRHLTVLLRLSLMVPVVTLGLLSACSTSQELEEVSEPTQVPTGTVPATLPPPPVPEVIPGLQQSEFQLPVTL